MAANKGGDSKQGLIISLVIAILLVITLGVVAYYGYDGQAALEKTAKEAGAKEQSAAKDRTSWKNRALTMQYMATGLKVPEEMTAYSSLGAGTGHTSENS